MNAKRDGYSFPLRDTAERTKVKFHNRYGIFTHPSLIEIGKKYGKTAAHVALRWNIQRDVVVIPKSVHKERIEANLNIFDFALSAEDMAAIDALDIDRSEIINHFVSGTARFLNGFKIHD